jgi:histidyl-tRNA synthetase
MMMADTMEALGIPRGSYLVKVNNRKLLDGVLESIGLGGEASAGRRLIVLRAIDKYDRLGYAGVHALLGEGRKDESGDYTKGAGLSELEAGRILGFISFGSGSIANEFLSPKDRTATVPFAEGYSYDDDQTFFGIAPSVENSLTGQEGLRELQEISKLVRAAQYGTDRIRVDTSVVRGLEYYTGPVFEVELTFSTDGQDGSPRFGSVGGGGRYDGLVSRFRGEPVPATGFSIGVSRLLAALEYLGKVETKAETGPVVVTVFDKDRIADYQAMVSSLRNAGIRAELYLGSGKFGPQMKYADKRNAPCVVIQGSDEKAKGEVTIKDLIIGAELAKLEKGRDEYLQKQAEAQRAVPEQDLVAAVRAVLDRHKLALPSSP